MVTPDPAPKPQIHNNIKTHCSGHQYIVDKLGLSCAKFTVVWLDLKLSFELKIEDKNVGDERKLG